MKPYQIAMGLALAGVAGLWLFGERGPVSGVAEAVVRERHVAPAAAAPRASATAPAATALILRLQPRALLVGEGGEATFGAGEGVFLGKNWTPPPPPPPPAPPPPPPSAPPLPFSYIGKAAADGAWEVYLARADKIYVVRAKTVIDGVYRVDAIAPPLMSLTYLPMNLVQQLNIGVLD